MDLPAAASSPACPRALPAQELPTHAQPFQPYGFGNHVLPDVPAKPLRDGRLQRVPVISGGTRDEARLFVGLFRALAGQPVTAQRCSPILGQLRPRRPAAMAPFDAARPVPHVQSLAPGPDGIGAIDYADEPQLDFWSGLP